MPIAPLKSNAANGIAFLIGAGFVAEAVAKACSSPQTVEINVRKRHATLMKWVNIGTIEGLGIVLIAAAIDPKHRNAIIAGGLTEAIVTYLEYWHGKTSGLANAGPETEEY
jgi:hypothetical protein